MHIRELDPADEGLIRRFWEIGKVADENGRPWSGYWSWTAAHTAFTTESSALEKVLLAAFDGQTMVGTAEISLPRLDNRHRADLEVYVDPQHQRRGVAAALFDAATDTARRRGRTVLATEVATPLDGPASAGMRLATRIGFRTGVVNDMKVVDLAATEHLWEPLLAETSSTATGYTLVTWRDVCPDEYVKGYCELLESFLSEAPTGDLDVEPERWDEQRLREKEQRLRRSRRHETTTVALSPRGEVVGLTEAMVAASRPDRGFQGATLVVPAHRGNRLGLRLKATNHRVVREAFPSCGWLLTGNADVNAAMNAVNDRLGYRTVERVHEMQRKVDPDG